ncbi:hypothetical protein MMC24_007960 [Lignoscripta atroalba]|nr:hypothetical protein [Lignoscripta atroalba]
MTELINTSEEMILNINERDDEDDDADVTLFEEYMTFIKKKDNDETTDLEESCVLHDTEVLVAPSDSEELNDNLKAEDILLFTLSLSEESASLNTDESELPVQKKHDTKMNIEESGDVNTH